MAAITSTLSPSAPNRRRRVRHKIQTPAYVSFTAHSQAEMLDLHEIVDISEEGISIQCHSPLEVEKTLSLCLDLADCSEPIYTTGQVIWSNATGRAGLRFSELPSDSLPRLREWLFVNVMAGVANGEAEIAAFTSSRAAGPPPPSYSDMLAAVSAVQRQVEALGSDLPAAMQLIAEHTRTLARASGAAIALAETGSDFMVCRASSGPDAPPVGARLQVGSGFSGECVKSGKLLRCVDAELDIRVDRDSCRALGIRSILAIPVRAGVQSVGLIEAFSSRPNAFSDADGKALQRLAETVLDAANRAARAENLPPLGAEPETAFAPSLGSVLFASAEKQNQAPNPDEKKLAGISLPRSHLILLIGLLAAIAMGLGWRLAPWIQRHAAPWIETRLHGRGHDQLPTVFASSHPPASGANLAIETASFDQLRQMAQQGDPAAENALGLRYATGDRVKLDEAQAVHWFKEAAEQGNVLAQSKLGSFYYSGRGVHQDLTQAYFWMVVARSSGDNASKVLSPIVSASLTRAQVTSIELEANRWLQQRSSRIKPAAGQLKASN
jgi:TPR repeat protein